MMDSHYQRMKKLSEQTKIGMIDLVQTYQCKSLEYILRDRRNGKITLPIVQYSRALDIMELYAKKNDLGRD